MRAMKAAGLDVRIPSEEDEQPYGTEYVIDGVPSVFHVTTNGYWAPPGKPLKVVFGSIYSRRRRLTIRERKTGFNVEDCVGRMKEYLLHEKEYLAEIVAKEKALTANRKLVEKLGRKLKIDRNSVLYLRHTGHETPDLVTLSMQIENITPADVERVVAALRRDVADLLVEKT